MSIHMWSILPQRLLMVTALAGFAMGMVGSAEVLEQILVKVNGDIITKTEFEQRQVLALRQRNLNLSEGSDELKKAIVDITPQLILDAVDELLIVQRGRELGYRMSDENFKRVIENIKKENKIETDEQFQEALKQEGLTLADLRKSLERQMIINQVQQAEVAGRLTTTEEEERAYYEAHKAEFTSPSEVTLREILIEVPDDGKAVSVGLDEEARERAESLRVRALGGENFEKLAAEYSDAPSKANAGLIGPIKRSEMAPAFQELLQQMKVGEVSKVVRTKRGYQLLKLEAEVEAQVLPFEQAREQIADRVYAQKRRAEMIKYMNRLRSQAIIEWKNEEIRKAYDQALAAAGSAAASPPETGR